MRYFKYILFLLLLTSSVYSQNNLIKSGNNLIKVGNSLLYFPTAEWTNEYSILFDGVDEYINTNNVLTALASTTVGTWSMWVKPVDATPIENDKLISFGFTSGSEYLFIDNTFDGKFRAIARNATEIKWNLGTTAAAFSDNTWTHIAIVQNGTAPILYVNGIAVAQSFATQIDKTFWFNDLGNLDNGRIGSLNWDGGGEIAHYNGNIDEVLFINRALTQPQIAAIYNGGAPKDESSISNGVTFLRMGDEATWDGSDFTFPDQINSNDATSVNVDFADKELDTP